jgi:hypothetical protein
MDLEETFHEFWDRKAFPDEALKFNYSILRREQKAALKQLPVIDIEDEAALHTDLEEVLRYDAAVAAGAGLDGINECVVRFGNRIWVIDTQGFTYARYIFELTNVPPRALHN